MRWADDFDAIRKNLKEIVEVKNKPKCPINPDRLLDACLKMDAKCTMSCPHHELWTGPDHE